MGEIRTSEVEKFLIRFLHNNGKALENRKKTKHEYKLKCFIFIRKWRGGIFLLGVSGRGGAQTLAFGCLSYGPSSVFIPPYGQNNFFDEKINPSKGGARRLA